MTTNKKLHPLNCFIKKKHSAIYNIVSFKAQLILVYRDFIASKNKLIATLTNPCSIQTGLMVFRYICHG